MKKLSQLFFASFALAAVLAFSGSASAFQAAPAKATTKAPAAGGATAKDISDATARGDVWLNTSSKVYHKSDDKNYGTTKQGKFMSEADAQKAGGHLSKEGATAKKSATKSTTKK
jgi:hypothetical protein